MIELRRNENPIAIDAARQRNSRKKIPSPFATILTNYTANSRVILAAPSDQNRFGCSARYTTLFKWPDVAVFLSFPTPKSLVFPARPRNHFPLAPPETKSHIVGLTQTPFTHREKR